MADPSILERLLRSFLPLYPRQFRQRVGSELIRTVTDALARNSVRHGRAVALAMFALHFADFVASGLTERLSSRHHRLGIKPTRESTMSQLIQDLRVALRVFFKQPGFTIVVVATIGLGVGANTAMFSIVNGVLLSRLPYNDPDELVIISQSDRMNGTLREGSSGPDYFDYLERQTVFDAMAAWGGSSPTLTDAVGDPERLSAVQATHTLFPLLGWEAELGRTFSADEDAPNGPRVALISHGLWTRRFGSDPNVVGRTVTLNDIDHVVIGVAPMGFQFPRAVDLWVPLQYGPTTDVRGRHSLGVIARMKDEVTIDLARENMTRIMADLENLYPEDNIGRGATVDSIDFATTGTVRSALLLLMGAVVLVLLIACANVANLLFARGATRQREIAVRSALGAPRSRIVIQMMVESLQLAVVGGTVGVLIAFGGIKLLLALSPSNLPRLNEITVSPTVLVFALLVTVAAGTVFGILPALQASRTNLTESLSEGGRTSTDGSAGKVRTGLAVAQIAIAFVLVVGAGLLIKSMWKLTQVDPGFRPENLVLLSVSLPQSRYPTPRETWPHAPEANVFFSEVLDRASRIPSVTGAAIALNHPLAAGWTTRMIVEGGPQTVVEGVEEERMRPVSPGYFSTIGTALLSGRDFSDFDRADAPAVAIINESFVRKYFRDENPIGKYVNFWNVDREVVGVVAEIRFMGLDEPSRPAIYSPMRQLPFTTFDIILRGTVGPDQIISAMRTELKDIDPQLAVYNTGTIEGIVSQSIGSQRFTMTMLALFAALALSLASVGIYGVISYGVSRRGHEFGIRMSLGAERNRVTIMVLRQGAKFASLGIGIGLVGSVALSKLMAGLLYNVNTLDLVTLGAVAMFLAIVALLASFVPAHRAGRVDPLVALRRE